MADKLQWRAWLQKEETQIFFEDLEIMRNDIIESWALGDYTRPTSEATAMLNAKALGQLQMLDSILDLRIEKRMEDE